MTYEKVFAKLSENPKNVTDEAVRLIVKIADTLIKDPTNLKIRTLKKSNSTISKKILAAAGALDCLKIMGFQELDTNLMIPANISIDKIREVKNALLMWKDSLNSSDTTQSVKAETSQIKPHNMPMLTETVKQIKLPPLVLTFTNPFLRRIETYFHNCLQYEDKDVQARAKKFIPITLLEEGAQKRLRTIQEHIKKNKLDDPDLSIQDTLILELLQWFKEDFFSWVDTPDCTYCGAKTHFSHMSTDTKLLAYTDRVELHRCDSCRKFTPFPRYNDLNILFETRRGRCGEWANAFTIFCRAMGWDARFVVDEGDHVWTEVYSIAQKRWLHCDPCENICDTPLIYENGWSKKISYVIAYSGEEVQDVTWRYSSNFKEVLKRRKNCTEQELVLGLMKLRAERQKHLSEPRRKYLTKRILMELVELMKEKQPCDYEKVGRKSGSSVWKLSRGEIQEAEASSHVWKIQDKDIVNNRVTIRYSAALDKYEYISGEKTILELPKWYQGAFESSSIFRKEEKDWKQVYLARKEGIENGTISWKFELESNNKVLDTVIINFYYATYENGKVDVKICSQDACDILPNGEKSLTTKSLCGSKALAISASLKGGKGDVAWQHAQMFRQTTDSIDFPFSITFIFK